mmetsp:Transcript_88715/g.153973  ORF Transcript_88715/g.153973 Transcript_88715/m.153973 type:complete len:125 (+) Transcript_88715:2720-3094(+)
MLYHGIFQAPSSHQFQQFQQMGPFFSAPKQGSLGCLADLFFLSKTEQVQPTFVGWANMSRNNKKPPKEPKKEKMSKTRLCFAEVKASKESQQPSSAYLCSWFVPKSDILGHDARVVFMRHGSPP